MGEYWKPVNIDKHQEVHPHRLHDGLKQGEWTTPGSATQLRVRQLIDSGAWAGDEIRMVSDYGGSEHMHGPVTNRVADYDDDWEDVSLASADPNDA